MKKLSLFRKILLAMLVLALVPFVVTSVTLSLNLRTVAQRLASDVADRADRQASENLMLRAQQVAHGITSFLKDCEEDVRLLSELPQNEATYLTFYRSHHEDVWHRNPATTIELRESLPTYRSMVLLDAAGNERIVVKDGRLLGRKEMKNVANPARTEFRCEDYFEKVRQLEPGKVYVSHLTGLHVTKEDQYASEEEARKGIIRHEYEGVVRFATPIYKDGRFAGAVVISLDHRHLMEFSQHIVPGNAPPVVFPSYDSGNYAFIFDDEGWIITHPKFWDIRGVDASGKLVPPYKDNSSPDEVRTGRIPYNLDYAGFIHPNYPKVAALAREKKQGYVDITNAGGARKIMAFAPILYGTGDYGKHGIFGAVTIGFQVDQFHELAAMSSGLVYDKLREHIYNTAVIVAVLMLLIIPSALALSRMITRPLEKFADGARRIASGDTTSRVTIASDDELGMLADVFNRMARQLEARKNRLVSILNELRSSRNEIISERNFKESVLESISSAITTYSPTGHLTSVNGNGRRLLGDLKPGTPYDEILAPWGDMVERVRMVLEGTKPYGREPLDIVTAEGRRHFEVGFFPIGDSSRGITVTMRDETEKEHLREEMTRMDRLASLGKLSAGIAHEVRNPLTGISLLLDDLHDRMASDPESQVMMRRALAEIERVEGLIKALLSYASPPRTEFREADLEMVVNDTMLLLRRECRAAGVTLEVETESIPPFLFDPSKIRQTILNIVKNALEALPRGGTINVTLKELDGVAAISVADNGPGIGETDLPFLFEPFFTKKSAGTGLGLSISHRIVDEHGGEIRVSSTVGSGTSFTIVLPMKRG